MNYYKLLRHVTALGAHGKLLEMNAGAAWEKDGTCLQLELQTSYLRSPKFLTPPPPNIILGQSKAAETESGNGQTELTGDTMSTMTPITEVSGPTDNPTPTTTWALARLEEDSDNGELSRRQNFMKRW